MARTRRYNRQDNGLFSKMAHGIGAFFALIGRGIAKAFHAFDQKLTIMVVPHSNGKVLNIRTNTFAIAIGTLIILGIAVTFIPFSKHSSGNGLEISRLREENRDTLASLDELRDENNNLLQTAKRFQTSLSHSLSLLGINQSENITKATGGNSDLASIFDTQDLASGTLKETADIKQLTSYLESAVQPVEQIGKMLESQGELFSDIPSIWPIKNGIGHISMAFGQNVHPIKGIWYIHRGIDFSTYRSGDGVVATANGQVAGVGFDSGLGNYVIIKHKHGIYTRYAHLSTIRVQKGDQVSQRDVIGTIGNTGLSTGPHLHYEIHIGSDVVDPAKYINIKQMAFINEDISINSIIGRGSTIKGDMKISGFMRIDGDLDGNLEATGNVIVGEFARINGNITAKSATISGVVKGNIIATESVHLMSSSSVIGDIQTHRLQADNNVILHGHCISLKDEGAYDEAVNSWQDAQAIASRSILQNIHISLDSTVFNSDLHTGISIADPSTDSAGFQAGNPLMEGVDALSSGLYFSAAQAAAQAAAKKADQEKKTSKVKKTSFSSVFEKSRIERELEMDGLPPEIAGMEPEEAVIYLKDAADIAAENLKASQMPENFADYRKKVSQFMRYIVKTNFSVESRSRAPKRGRKMSPQVQVVVINQKLDEVAQWLLHSHSDTLHMLAKIEEINGLLVDLMAT